MKGAELSLMSLGQGEPLVFLHGLVSGNMATWYSALALPLAATRQVILYDQRGHGDSTVAAAGYDLETQVDDLAAVLDHAGAGEVDVVGHSMGALIALHFALKYPWRVRRLVLVDAPMPARQFISPSLTGVVSKESVRAYAESLHPGLTGRRKERLYQRLSALIFETSLVQDVMAMGLEPESELRGLDVPVQLLYGSRSPCLSAGYYLQGVLPEARLELLDCGHYVPEEAPQALLAGISRFLCQQPVLQGQ